MIVFEEYIDLVNDLFSAKYKNGYNMTLKDNDVKMNIEEGLSAL